MKPVNKTDKKPVAKKKPVAVARPDASKTMGMISKQINMSAMKDTENAADAKKPGDAKEDTTKKTGTTAGKSNKLGGGGRFQQMLNKGVSPALAGFIGRKKYGAKAMSKMSAAGRARAK